MNTPAEMHGCSVLLLYVWAHTIRIEMAIKSGGLFKENANRFYRLLHILYCEHIPQHSPPGHAVQYTGTVFAILSAQKSSTV